MRSVVGDLTDGRTVTVVWTDRADGDFATPADDRTSASIRRRIADRPWVWARQVHGREVVIVDDGPWSDRCGREADALVTRRDDLVLEVRTADCAVLGMWSDDGVVAAVHCGWRGLVAGVVDAAVDAMRSLTPAPLRAVLGPSIGVECYEFGVGDLQRVVDVAGDDVMGTTVDGRPALDVRAGVRAALDRREVVLVGADARCTACASTEFHSHRARGESGRQALAVWIGRA